MKFLCTFDFDDTMITDNSDYSILNVLPDGSELPQEIQDLYSSRSWIEYMKHIFMYLNELGITKKDILTSIEEIQLMPGFKELFHFLVQNDCDIIIISDSNSVFIEHSLQYNKLRSSVKEVFTNHAEFDQDGLLQLWGYHKQDWCDLSTENLCKGFVLQEFIKKQEMVGVKYDKVAYVGDGGNDYCPALRLSANDIVFPRKDYKLDLKISENAEKVKASVVRWQEGFDIINHLKSIFSSYDAGNPG